MFSLGIVQKVSFGKSVITLEWRRPWGDTEGGGSWSNRGEGRMARKRVFFSLASGALLACFGLLACLLYLAQPRLEELGRFLDDMVAGTFVLGAGFLWLRFFCTALAAYQGRELSPVGRSGHLLPTLLPLAILLGRRVGVRDVALSSSPGPGA